MQGSQAKGGWTTERLALGIPGFEGGIEELGVTHAGRKNPLVKGLTARSVPEKEVFGTLA